MDSMASQLQSQVIDLEECSDDENRIFSHTFINPLHTNNTTNSNNTSIIQMKRNKSMHKIGVSTTAAEIKEETNAGNTSNEKNNDDDEYDSLLDIKVGYQLKESDNESDGDFTLNEGEDIEADDEDEEYHEESDVKEYSDLEEDRSLMYGTDEEYDEEESFYGGTSDRKKSTDTNKSTKKKNSGTKKKAANKKTAAKKGRNKKHVCDMDDEDEDSEELSWCSEHKTFSPKENKKAVIMCTSTHDAITEEDLETPHVCWVSPNKSSKQCFNLSTLLRVAGTITTNTTKDFLQPPHFRCPMEKELRGQIRDKFGSQALCLDEIDVEIDGTSFQIHLERYLHGVMGSSDLYVCPLCYSEAYRRYIQNNRKKNKHPYHEFHFQHDPISVLLDLDDQLHIASTFSFRKMTEIKQHMTHAHHQNSTTIDNALFNRFQVRASDGLLQRYLEFLHDRHADNRDMAQYWQEGNNFHFLHLLHLVHSPFQGIPMSFRLNKGMWKQLSAPYQKELNREDRDFVVADEECIQCYSDMEDVFSDMEGCSSSEVLNPEESLILELRKRRGIKPATATTNYAIYKSTKKKNSGTKKKAANKRRGIKPATATTNNAILSSSEEEDFTSKTPTTIVSMSPTVVQHKISKRKRTPYIDTDDEEEEITPTPGKLSQILSSDDEIPTRIHKSRTQILTQILSSDDELPTRNHKSRTQIHESDDDDNDSIPPPPINQQIDSFLQYEIKNNHLLAEPKHKHTQRIRYPKDSIDFQIDSFLHDSFKQIHNDHACTTCNTCDEVLGPSEI